MLSFLSLSIRGIIRACSRAEKATVFHAIMHARLYYGGKRPSSPMVNAWRSSPLLFAVRTCELPCIGFSSLRGSSLLAWLGSEHQMLVGYGPGLRLARRGGTSQSTVLPIFNSGVNSYSYALYCSTYTQLLIDVVEDSP